MKKKIFGGIAVVAIVVAVAFNVNLNNSKTNSSSLLALANVEALADGENPGDEEDDPGFVTLPKTVQCTPPGFIPMEGGLAIYCIPGGPDATCDTFNPCN